jgi:hypothetical protein
MKRVWFPNGILKFEEWWFDGHLHRVDGPAFMGWHQNGQISAEEWFLNGQYHREDGPAQQCWYSDGRIAYHRWYIDGLFYSSVQEWAKALIEFGYKTKSEALLMVLEWGNG